MFVSAVFYFLWVNKFENVLWKRSSNWRFSAHWNIFFRFQFIFQVVINNGALKTGLSTISKFTNIWYVPNRYSWRITGNTGSSFYLVPFLNCMYVLLNEPYAKFRKLIWCTNIKECIVSQCQQKYFFIPHPDFNYGIFHAFGNNRNAMEWGREPLLKNFRT